MTVQAAEPRSLLRRLYDWCVAAAGKPHALAILTGVAFAESSFFPIPPDVMLVPMSLARPDRAFLHRRLVHAGLGRRRHRSATPSGRCFMTRWAPG